jgi:hypothetical protein
MAPKSNGEAPRNGQVEGGSNEAGWREYVAQWPLWRPLMACTGVCPYALVCGRARMCLQARDAHPRVVYALARLSAAAGERPPTRLT